MYPSTTAIGSGVLGAGLVGAGSGNGGAIARTGFHTASYVVLALVLVVFGLALVRSAYLHVSDRNAG